MFNKESCGLSILGISLGLGIIGGSYIIGEVVRDVKLSHQTIDVKGYAERDVVSDSAVWTFTITVEDASLEEANRKLRQNEDKLDAYLTSVNILPQEINRSPTRTFKRMKKVAGPDYVFDTNEVDFYEVSRVFNVQSKDVYKVKDAAEKSSRLAEEGVALETTAIEYFSTDLGKVKLELLGEATKNAVTRAEELAKNSGSVIGVVRSARQGVFQITPEFSTDVANYGISDTSTIKKKAKAIAAVSFALGK